MFVPKIGSHGAQTYRSGCISGSEKAAATKASIKLQKNGTNTTKTSKITTHVATQPQ
jgi:hypothetical protein